MTEAEWLTSDDPRRMLQSMKHLTERALKTVLCDRKLRLFAAACCRGTREFVDPQALESPRNDLRKYVLVAERIADGLALPPMSDLEHSLESHTLFHGAAGSVEWACHAAVAPSASGAATGVIDALDDLIWDNGPTNLGAVYLREIFGNPFRRAPFSPSWRTSTAVALASQMYDARDFGAMPILADALQDVGCDSADVLDHCRVPGLHVRGCWVVDLVLGKA